MAAHKTRRSVEKVVEVLNAVPAAVRGILLLLAAAGFGSVATETVHGIAPSQTPLHAEAPVGPLITRREVDSLMAIAEKEHLQQDSTDSKVLAAVAALAREVCLLRLEVRGERHTEACAGARLVP